MDNALRLAGRPRGVEDEQRVLRVHRLRFAVRRSLRHFFLVPNIPPGLHVALFGIAPDHDGLLDRRSLLERLVRDAL